MGTVESSHISGSIFPEHSSQIVQSDFKVIANYSYTQHLDPYYGSNFTVISHKQKSQLQFQKYELFFNTYEEYQTYQEIYHWRNKSKHLVQARAIIEKPTNRLCGSFHEATIFLQRIPIRACEITDIPIEEGLYLLYTCFLGFRKIYERTGYFDISLDMICINKDALVKVWLNTNLSKIYPQLYSINQNLTQTDFIRKILLICEPLIDYDDIEEKFSDFLKGCYFPTHQTPKKEDNNKFCKYSKVKQPLSQNMDKKTLSAHFLTFDKIIQYFQGYLNKHNLVIAREMKSIKDLFKIQQRIEFKQQNLHNKPVIPSMNQKVSQKIQPLKFINDCNQTKHISRRKNSNRINNRLISDRSKGDKTEILFSYKSEEYMKNIKQFKEPEFVMKRPPSISFGYQPLIKNDHQQLFSPQHISPKKRYYFQGRQRTKSTVVPNISFNTYNQVKESDRHPTPEDSYKSTQRYFYKNKTKENHNVTSVKQIKNDDNKICKEQNFQIQNKSSFTQLKENPQHLNVFDKIQLNQQQSNLKQNIKNKKKTICYAIDQQWSIDEDIAKDLDLLEKIEGS